MHASGRVGARKMKGIAGLRRTIWLRKKRKERSIKNRTTADDADHAWEGGGRSVGFNALKPSDGNKIGHRILLQAI